MHISFNVTPTTFCIMLNKVYLFSLTENYFIGRSLRCYVQVHEPT